MERVQTCYRKSISLFFRLETTRLQDENTAFKEKCNQFENTISRDLSQIKDLESRIKIIDGDRLSLTESKTIHQHSYTELQVRSTLVSKNTLLYLNCV